MEHITKFLVAFYVRANEVVDKAKDRGATATEYALLVAMIAVVLAVAIGAFGTTLGTFFNTLGTKISGWASSVG